MAQAEPRPQRVLLSGALKTPGFPGVDSQAQPVVALGLRQLPSQSGRALCALRSSVGSWPTLGSLGRA